MIAQCPRCGSPIQPGSAFCPKCGLPLAQPPQPAWGQPQPPQWGSPSQTVGGGVKHGFGWGLGCLLVPIAIIAGLAGLGVLANAVTPKPTPTPVPTVGQPMSINRDGKIFTVTVESVRESASLGSQMPRSGYEFLSVMVLYKADHTSADASYNEWDWSATAASHKINTYAETLSPALGAGDLYADGTAEGYVTFEVPTSGEVRVGYTFTLTDSAPTFEVVVRAS